jgi:hypothetical protein
MRPVKYLKRRERQRLESWFTRREAKAGAFAYGPGGKGWSLRLQGREAKAGAFAYESGGKGWSLRLRGREAKAGAFAYEAERQRLEPSLTGEFDL